MQPIVAAAFIARMRVPTAARFRRISCLNPSRPAARGSAMVALRSARIGGYCLNINHQGARNCLLTTAAPGEGHCDSTVGDASGRPVSRSSYVVDLTCSAGVGRNSRGARLSFSWSRFQFLDGLGFRGASQLGFGALERADMTGSGPG